MDEQSSQLDEALRLWFKERPGPEGSATPSSSCLDEEHLACYAEGLLSKDEVGLVESHLAQCSDCCDLVLALSMFDAEPAEALPPHLRQWAKTLISHPVTHEVWELAVRLARGAFEVLKGVTDLKTPPGPVPVPVRGQEVPDEYPLVVFSRVVAGIMVNVELERLANEMCNVKVLAKDSDTQTIVPSLRYSLFRMGVEVASLAAVRGEGLFEQLKPGDYEIRLYRAPMELLGSIALSIVES